MEPGRARGIRQGDLTDKVFRVGEELGYIVILAVLWLVASLPVITLPAATAAVYGALNAHIGDNRRGYVKPFVAVFKDSFSTITVRGLGLTGAVVLFAFNSYFYLALGESTAMKSAVGILQFMACLIGVAVATNFFWASGAHWERSEFGPPPGLRNTLRRVRDRPVASLLTALATMVIPLMLMWLSLWQFSVFIVGLQCYANTWILATLRR